MSYVVVKFPERREVFIDDQSQGDNVDGNGTPRALVAGEGWHTFRLGGPSDYTPPSQTLNVPDATQINPFPVVFEKNATRLGSAIERPETLVASAVADPLVHLAFAPPSEIDSVTGLGMRHAFEADQAVFVRAANEARLSLACLMIDVDDFKHFNETYGHPQGDIVLRETAACLLAAVRGKGRAYRYGGDEYVALLLNFTNEDARGVGERVRIAIAGLKLDGIEAQIGVTIGVATGAPGAFPSGELVNQADQALLVAKKGGKRRTVVFGETQQDAADSSAAVAATPEELSKITDWVESERWEVRRDATRDLVDLAWRKRIFPLEEFRGVPRRLLKDPHPEVRMLALEAITAIMRSEGEQASGYYSRSLTEVVERDDDLDVRARAIATIGNSGDARFLEQIYDWIGRWDVSSYTRVWPIAALTGLTHRLGTRIIEDLRHRIDATAAEQERQRYVEALKTVRDVLR